MAFESFLKYAATHEKGILLITHWDTYCVIFPATMGKIAKKNNNNKKKGTGISEKLTREGIRRPES